MAIDTGHIIKQYDANLQNYEKLVKVVQSLLVKLVNKHGVKPHSITQRIKDVASFLNKIRRNNIEKPFEQIHDLVGFRVVCLFLSDIDDIRKIIQEGFAVFEENDKINDTEANIFGYMDIQLKARLKSANEPDSSEEISKIPFEIQVRTIAQDAWASISHYLDYKKPSTVPKQLKRDFHALSGLFYVADTHFLFLKQEQSKTYFNT